MGSPLLDSDLSSRDHLQESIKQPTENTLLVNIPAPQQNHSLNNISTIVHVNKSALEKLKKGVYTLAKPFIFFAKIVLALGQAVNVFFKIITSNNPYEPFNRSHNARSELNENNHPRRMVNSSANPTIRSQLSKEEKKEIATDLQTIKKIRKKLAKKLFLDENKINPSSNKMLDTVEVFAWDTLKKRLPELTALYQKSPSGDLQELLFLINHPLSKEDLTNKKFTEGQIKSFANQLIAKIGSDSSLTSPQLLDHTWKKQEYLGRGASKIVHAVRSNATQQLAVLTHAIFSTKEELVELFDAGKREAQISLQLSGKQGWPVVHAITYQPETQEGQVTIIHQGMHMEKFDGDGVTLLKLLAQGSPLNTVENKKRIITDIFAGLLRLHTKHKMIHGDIKPANLLFKIDPSTQRLSVVMGDLGSVKKFGSPLESFSPAYSSPEYENEVLKKKGHHFENVNVPATDVFSLGITLYLLCKGIPSHVIDENTLAMHVDKLREQNFSPLHEENPMDVLLRNMLNPDPVKRISLKEASERFQIISALPNSSQFFSIQKSDENPASIAG